MRDISAVLIGLLPALILWGAGEAERTVPNFYAAAGGRQPGCLSFAPALAPSFPCWCC